MLIRDNNHSICSVWKWKACYSFRGIVHPWNRRKKCNSLCWVCMWDVLCSQLLEELQTGKVWCHNPSHDYLKFFQYICSFIGSLKVFWDRSLMSARIGSSAERSSRVTLSLTAISCTRLFCWFLLLVVLCLICSILDEAHYSVGWVACYGCHHFASFDRFLHTT